MNKTDTIIWFCKRYDDDGRTTQFAETGTTRNREDYEKPPDAIGYQFYSTYRTTIEVDGKDREFIADFQDKGPFTYIVGKVVTLEELDKSKIHRIYVENMKSLGLNEAIQWNGALYPYNPNTHNYEPE